ncbi:MAG: PA3611 family quorum-sensing-regulated virulence factor [Rhizobiaceae bacterium]|jgi:hypothetical protein|nr:PA3611 family quorum-sensing-regulated virulence factor [Rhizobiaceae bacterium]
MRALVPAVLVSTLATAAWAQTEAEKLQIAISAAGGVEKLLEKVAREQSAGTPRSIAPNMELRSVTAAALTLKSSVVFTTVSSKRAFDPAQLRVQAGTLAVCQSTTGQLIQNHGVVVAYEYFAANSEPVYLQVIDAAACKQVAQR